MIIGLAGVALILIIFIQTRRFLIRKKTFSRSELEQPPISLEESDGSEHLLHPADSISTYSIANNCKKK